MSLAAPPPQTPHAVELRVGIAVVGLGAGHGPERDTVADGQVEPELAGPLLRDGIVARDGGHAAPVLCVGSADHDARHIAVDDVFTPAAFERGCQRQPVRAGVGVAEHGGGERPVADDRVVGHGAGIVGLGDEQRVVDAGKEAAELDHRHLDLGALDSFGSVALFLEIDVGIGAERAELGLGPGIGLQLEAGERVVGVAVAVAVDIDAEERAEAGFETEIAADPEAGFDEINAFFAGARQMRADIKQRVAFVESWYDPGKAAEYTNAQVATGVDGILQLTGNFEACKLNKVYCFGSKADENYFAPIDYVYRQLLAKKSEGFGILLASEELDDLMKLCDRIAVIHRGRIVGVVEPAATTPQHLGLMMAGQAFSG